MKNKLLLAIAIGIIIFNGAFTKIDSSTNQQTQSDNENFTFIQLSDEGTTFEGNGVIVSGNTIFIQSAGNFQLTGTLSDGQVVVNTEDEEDVQIYLNNVSITSTSSEPIYIENAKNTIITLVNGSDNYLADQKLSSDEEPNATIFSNDDLFINGEGSLTIQANNNNGIATDDDLVIENGVITINASNNGIKAKDTITIENGSFIINAIGNGIQTSESEDLEKGIILINNGEFNLITGSDGIQASNTLEIKNGNFKIYAGGEETSASSYKALKATNNLTIDGGTYYVESYDDAIHSNSTVIINDGIFELYSADDGIHSDTTLEINGGEIVIQYSYEGLEASIITINDGSITINSNDDGINGASGNSYGGGGGGMNQNDGSEVYVNGGYVYINAYGDGFDSNGYAEINGGIVIVQGPVSNNNGPLDVNGELTVNGGTLISFGSAGMPVAPSANSDQNSMAIFFNTGVSAGTLVNVSSSNGESIISATALKDFQYFVFSSPDLTLSTEYVISVGGNATGDEIDGVYYNGTYSAGSQYIAMTLSSTVTSNGNINSQFGGGGGGGGRHK